MPVLGIDPGAKGAAVLITQDRRISFVRFIDKDEATISRLVFDLAVQTSEALIEKVGARPKDGKQTMFVFGSNCGFIRGTVIAYGCSIEYVQPQTWVLEFGCGGLKTTSAKMRAYQEAALKLFPELKKVPQDLGAAILIAEYAWRKKYGQLQGKKVFDGVKRGRGVVGRSAQRVR